MFLVVVNWFLCACGLQPCHAKGWVRANWSWPDLAWLITSWDGVTSGRKKPFHCVCNRWTTPRHHVLSLHFSPSSLTWSPTGQEQRRQILHRVFPDTQWLLTTPAWNSHLSGRKWNAAQTAQLHHTQGTSRSLHQQGQLRMLNTWFHTWGCECCH